MTSQYFRVMTEDTLFRAVMRLLIKHQHQKLQPRAMDAVGSLIADPPNNVILETNLASVQEDVRLLKRLTGSQSSEEHLQSLYWRVSLSLFLIYQPPVSSLMFFRSVTIVTRLRYRHSPQLDAALYHWRL